MVIVREDDGAVDVRQASTRVGLAATGGAMWGGLIGLMFLAPSCSAWPSARWQAKGCGRPHSDVGVGDHFVDELREGLAPGSAALVLLVRDMAPDKVLPNIREPGRVIQSSLSDKVEARLDAALASAKRDT